MLFNFIFVRHEKIPIFIWILLFRFHTAAWRMRSQAFSISFLFIDFSHNSVDTNFCWKKNTKKKVQFYVMVFSGNLFNFFVACVAIQVLLGNFFWCHWFEWKLNFFSILSLCVCTSVCLCVHMYATYQAASGNHFS